MIWNLAATGSSACRSVRALLLWAGASGLVGRVVDGLILVGTDSWCLGARVRGLAASLEAASKPRRAAPSPG